MTRPKNSTDVINSIHRIGYNCQQIRSGAIRCFTQIKRTARGK
jgi:hypothetical protein